MPSTHLFLAPLFLGTAMSAACSEPADPTPDAIEQDASTSAPGPLTEETFLQRFADAYCRAITPCCDMENVENDCERAGLEMVTEQKTELLKQGSPWRFNAPLAQRCLDRLDDLPNDCSAQVWHMDCYNAFSGTVEPGSPCLYGWECSQSEESYDQVRNWCVFYQGYEPFCQRQRFVRQVGEPCDRAYDGPAYSSDIEDCDEQGECLHELCYPLSGLGGRCPCLDSYACGAEVTCEPLRNDGEACGLDRDCVSGACRSSNHTCWSISEYNSLFCN